MQQSISLSDTFDLFVLDAESRGFTPDTLRFYRGRLGLFLAWCEKRSVTMLHELSGGVIREYLAELQNRGNLSSAYIHSHARAIKTLCRFCQREGLTEKSCFDNVKMPKLAKTVRPALPAADIQALLSAADCERDKAMLLFVLDSGVRAAELCALDVGDVASDGTVTVRQGKGRKDRMTYIGAATRKQLLRYFAFERGGKPPVDEALFTSQRGGTRMTYFGFAQTLKRLRLRSGVKCSPHTLRRTMAINSLRNGMDLYTLAKMLGHADIQVLRHYLPLLDDDVKTAARRHGVVDQLLKK